MHLCTKKLKICILRLTSTRVQSLVAVNDKDHFRILEGKTLSTITQGSFEHREGSPEVYGGDRCELELSDLRGAEFTGSPS